MGEVIQVQRLEISRKFLDEIVERASKIFGWTDASSILACIQCGVCTGGCPSGRRTAWRVRTLIRRAQLGMREEALSDDELWDCTTCYTCQERCPRGVTSTDFIRIIRNIAFEEGYARKNHLYVARNFLTIGHAIPHNDEMRALRKKLGLPENPPTSLTYPEVMKEIEKLTQKTGFKEKVERNLAKGGK